MKTKTKILTTLTTLIGTSSFIGLTMVNNNHTSLNTNSNLKENEEFYTETGIDARLIGAVDGSFDIKYTDIRHCILTNIDIYFTAKGEFNFNGGHFIKDGVKYIITEIDDQAFYHYVGTPNYHFDKCYLTIPSTITRIGDYAFYANSKNGICLWSDKEIIGINFEEGIEDIHSSSFELCDDINKTIKLPNSVKHLGDDAFSLTKITSLDLTALDHVINVDCPIDDYDSPLPSSIKKIYVKDEATKAKYCADNNWKAYANKILVK